LLASAVTADELFDVLDLNSDGALSRAELGRAARQLGWHWHQAPFYAVLDFLIIRAPLSRAAFVSCLERMARDPHGPYGEVLRTASHFPDLRTPGRMTRSDIPPEPAPSGAEVVTDGASRLARALASTAGADASRDYDHLVRGLDPPPRVSIDATGLLVIDPQVSFTRGTWMQSIGSEASIEVEPIRLAFGNCASLLRRWYPRLETMFTRCPFPPESYDWDEDLARIVDTSQPYLVKPGNSVMWPPTNGFQEWVYGLLERGKSTLVMGGCTLNSCVRISSIEVYRAFGTHGLKVLVDLDLCGARRYNYLRSDLFGGVSSVASAVLEMTTAGVMVAAGVTWE
jgi:hypothetical protein